MVALRIYYDGERAGPLFRRAVTRMGDQVRAAARKTATETAEAIEQEGRDDIRAAPGNWGARWPAGLHARVSEGGGNIRISVTHEISYFNAHERGAIIRGHPLLWIPFKFGGDELRGVSAKDFPGRLFRVDRKSDGLPMLLEKSGTGAAVPRYFGKKEVYLPKKFHIEEIARKLARLMPKRYKKTMRDL